MCNFYFVLRKLTTKKEEESKGGGVYIEVAKRRAAQITLVLP
jgi:hypothetical protein